MRDCVVEDSATLSAKFLSELPQCVLRGVGVLLDDMAEEDRAALQDLPGKHAAGHDINNNS